jgi:KTSC domain
VNASLPIPILVSAPLVLGLLPVPVASSLLSSVAYAQDRAILQLEFRGGAVYQYHGVPRQSYQELLEADSHGAYFNRHIRNIFPYALVPPASQSGAIDFPSFPCSQGACPILD